MGAGVRGWEGWGLGSGEMFGLGGIRLLPHSLLVLNTSVVKDLDIPPLTEDSRQLHTGPSRTLALTPRPTLTLTPPGSPFCPCLRYCNYEPGDGYLGPCCPK